MGNQKVKVHLDEARTALNRLGKKGWLYCGRVKDRKTSRKIYKFVWRKNGGDINASDVPVLGDVVENIKGGRSTYSTISTKGNNTGNWRKNRNNQAYVSQSFIDGTALFLQIVYKE